MKNQIGPPARSSNLGQSYPTEEGKSKIIVLRHILIVNMLKQIEYDYTPQFLTW